MKANEIMVGDYFRVTKDVCIKKGTVVEIRNIDADNNFPEKGLFGCASCRPLDENQFTGGVWLDYLEPIPLTPEILEKNGWYKSHYGYGRDCMRLDGNEDELPDGAENALASALWSIDKDYQYHHLEFFMWRGHTMTTVHYVHELQHVFRLHGVEKVIVL